MTAAGATRPVAPRAGEGRGDGIHPQASPPDVHTADADERWAQWVARGVERDRRRRVRLVGVAWLAGSALLVALAIYMTLAP